MGKATLHLWIDNFKCSQTLIICDGLPETDFLFGINLQKKYCLSYCWDLERQVFIQREVSFLTYIRNKKEHHYFDVVKAMLKIPPRHNSAIPIKIKGHCLRNQVAYFISNQQTNKGLDPKTHVIDGIYNIKGILTLHIIVVNYTTNHVTFNSGHYIGHMELPTNNMSKMFVNSVITQKMMDNKFNQTPSSPFYLTFPQK